MKSLRKVSMAVAIVALAWAVAKAITIYQTTLINESALAYTKSYPIDTNAVYTGSNLAGTMTYSTATLSADTFSDGAQSTGSFNVASVSGLKCAVASDTVTINSNLLLPSDWIMVTLPGYRHGFQFSNNIDFLTGVNTSSTAINIAAAMNNSLPYVTASANSNSVSLTAQFCGAKYNSAGLYASSSSMTVTSANWAGGLDNAYVSVNGYKLVQGTSWNQNASANTTATNIATAINANANTSRFVTAAASTSHVNLTSNATGVNAYLLASNTANITKNNANMTSGATPGWSLGGTVINIPSHNLTLAYPVLYSVGSAPAATGLTDQTTYYAYVVDANNIKLADTSAHAVAGTNFAVLASTSSQTTADTYTLTPLAFTGSASAQWQTSDDNSTWASMTGISAVSISGTSSTSWASLDLSHRYLRMTVTKPTTGGAQINLTLTGTQ
jgi:hypothetical protein